LELKRLDNEFHMSWICLILEAPVSDPDNPVENPDLVVTWTTNPKPASEFQLKVLGKFGLIPIEVVIVTKSCEVIAMNDTN
jgi:hypothetical protein